MLQKETWNLCQILGIHITFWYYKCGIYRGGGEGTEDELQLKFGLYDDISVLLKKGK